MENPPYIERKVDIKPSFDLTQPRVSRELALFFMDRGKDGLGVEAQRVFDDQRKRIELLFEENGGISDEKDLRSSILNKIEERIKKPDVSYDEALNLNSDANFLKSVFCKVDSWKDSLMGFYNRRGVVEILGLISRYPNELLGANSQKITERGFSLMLLDVDNLKKWNDQENHLRGDRALTEFANAISGNVRPTDLVARLSGDEVLIIALGADENDANLADTKISKRLDEITIEGEKITYSAGCDNTKNWEDIKNLLSSESFDLKLTSLLKDADSKLYEAKSAGRNQIRFVGE